MSDLDYVAKIRKSQKIQVHRMWTVPREFLPARSVPSDLIRRLWVSRVFQANFPSQAVGVGDHRNSCKVQMMDGSPGLYWVPLKILPFWVIHRGIQYDTGGGGVSGVFIYWIFPARSAPTYTVLVVRFLLISNM